MSYTTEFTYTATGAVKVANVVAFLDKRNGNIVVEFDCRGKDWNTADANVPQAKIKYGGAVKTTIDLTNLSNKFKKYRVLWLADAELSVINHGSNSVTCCIHEEDDTEQLFAQNVIVDLDPVEFHYTALEEVDFGDDSTPKMEFTLKDLRNKNTKITPTVSIDGATATGATVTVTTATNSTSFASGYIVLNGVTFEESTEFEMDHADAGKALWSKATKYSIDTTTLSGSHTVTLDLVCSNI